MRARQPDRRSPRAAAAPERAARNRHPRSTTRHARPHGLVRTRWVLDQQHQEPTVADGDPLEPTERCAETIEAFDDLLRGGAERTGEGGGRERVVDVVETRDVQLDVVRGLRKLE